MKLTLLGTGPFLPETPHASAGYVVESGGQTIKLDFGRGNLLRMAEAGIDWRMLDAIFISHIHPDHVSDLVQYLQAYTLLRRSGEIKEVQMFGPEGFGEYFERLKAAIEAPQEHMPEVRELTQDTFELGDNTITTAPLVHSVPDIGVRIDSDGKALCYTGDTGPCDSLTQLANGTDVLLTECAAERPEPHHMTPQDIAALANEAGVQTVVLTHYPTDPAQREEIRTEIAGNCAAEVIAGQDSQTIQL